ncbi:hypothetical protein HGB25_01945 [Candidatus Saccharibacteria bacterium]|nr:hypothetical protein [Candidatus Saccharibacteria bacterium]
MTDIDFDELDKAVNSLATDNGLSTANPSVGGDDSKVTVGNTDRDLKSVSASVESPKPTAPVRSSGQFMDVVHPSSDMRRGRVIPPEREPKQTDQPVDKTVELADQTPVTMPDPIDSPQQPDSKVSGMESYMKPDDSDKVNDDTEAQDEGVVEQSELPDSPFISGAVVEKRPLGAFSSESVDSTPETSDNTEPDTTNVDHEADTIPEPESAPAKDAEPGLIAANISSGNSTIANPSSGVDTSTPVVSEKPVGPTSIVQQYKEQPSSGDQTNGSIYNADSYNKNLVISSSKKPVFMWILGIVGLVIVGAGIGALTYFVVLPMLNIHI